jgi:mxaJ protein
MARMGVRTTVTIHLVIDAALFIAARSAAAQEAPPRELRVCADPNNLPFSNQRLEGFENKVAQLVADELHATLLYTWMPQRRGFVRRTLSAHDCDLVVGVPSGFDPVLSTKPYYRSTYVFVYAKRRHLELRSFDDPVLRQLTIGLHAITEDGANTPPTHALARRGIIGNIVGFKMWDSEEVENPPGTIVDAVASGRIDTAIVWGPIAGYFAKRQPIELEVVPVSPSVDRSLPLVFDMAMGVRHGEDRFKAELEEILDRRRQDIQQILRDFGVPLVDPQATTEGGAGCER